MVGQKVGETYYVLRELVLEQGSIAEMCDRFREIFPRHASEVWVYGDASSRGRPAQTGPSDYSAILQAMRTYAGPLRLKVTEQNPLVPMRINAANRALMDEAGRVRVQIDPACTELIADLEQVLRDGQKIKKTTAERSLLPPHPRVGRPRLLAGLRCADDRGLRRHAAPDHSDPDAGLRVDAGRAGWLRRIPADHVTSAIPRVQPLPKREQARLAAERRRPPDE